MKKLILFISLALAFSAGFAGAKAPAKVGILHYLPVYCAENHQLLPVVFNKKTQVSSYSFNKPKELDIANFSASSCITNFLGEKFYQDFNLSSNDSDLGLLCLAFSFEGKANEIKKIQRGQEAFSSYFLESLLQKGLEIKFADVNATCGNSNKKIKPTTITNIKRFHPVILETLE